MPAARRAKKTGKKGKGTASAKRRTTRRTASTVLDVRTPRAAKKLATMLTKGPLTLVLVYADWCGHCHNYKDNVWSQLKSLKNKRANLASVHYDQLANTPLANAKIRGYPSLLVVGKDQRAAEFKEPETGEPTNALPGATNVELMKTLATADVDEITRNVPEVTAAAAPEPEAAAPESELMSAPPPTGEPAAPIESESLLSEDALKARAANTESVTESLNTLMNATKDAESTTYTPGPAEVEAAQSSLAAVPDVAEDLVQSQRPAGTENAGPAATALSAEPPAPPTAEPPASAEPLEPTATGTTEPQSGGSLYHILLEAARTTAPAAVLTAAALAAKRGRRTSLRKRVRRSRGARPGAKRGATRAR